METDEGTLAGAEIARLSGVVDSTVDHFINLAPCRCSATVHIPRASYDQTSFDLFIHGGGSKALNITRARAKLDTAGDCNVISRNLVLKCRLADRVDKVRRGVSYTMLNGKVFKPREQITLQWTAIDSTISQTTHFYVADKSPYELVFGRFWDLLVDEFFDEELAILVNSVVSEHKSGADRRIRDKKWKENSQRNKEIAAKKYDKYYRDFSPPASITRGAVAPRDQAHAAGPAAPARPQQQHVDENADRKGKRRARDAHDDVPRQDFAPPAQNEDHLHGEGHGIPPSPATPNAGSPASSRQATPLATSSDAGSGATRESKITTPDMEDRVEAGPSNAEPGRRRKRSTGAGNVDGKDDIAIVGRFDGRAPAALVNQQGAEDAPNWFLSFFKPKTNRLPPTGPGPDAVGG